LRQGLGGSGSGVKGDQYIDIHEYLCGRVALKGSLNHEGDVLRLAITSIHDQHQSAHHRNT
jgi:hypothetical protein